LGSKPRRGGGRQSSWKGREMRARWEVEREVDGIDKGEGREESRKVEEKERGAEGLPSRSTDF